MLTMIHVHSSACDGCHIITEEKCCDKLTMIQVCFIKLRRLSHFTVEERSSDKLTIFHACFINVFLAE